MRAFAVFLRGVNVGGVTIKMAQLRDALTPLPLGHVKTLLASGNIVCTFNGAAAELETLIAGALRERFGYDSWLMAIPAARLREITALSPYPADDPARHSYVTFVSDAELLVRLAAEADTETAEYTVLGPEAVAWPAPKGGTLESPFSRITAKSVYRRTTTRNLRTLLSAVTACEATGPDPRT